MHRLARPLGTNARVYEDYYHHQVGHGLPVFAGGRNYRGHGLGNLLAGIGRMVMPLLKTGGKALLKEGVRSGLGVAQDVIAGSNVKTAFKRRAQQAGKRLVNRAVARATGQTPTKKRRIKRPSGKPQGQKRANRRRAKDIFG